MNTITAFSLCTCDIYINTGINEFQKRKNISMHKQDGLHVLSAAFRANGRLKSHYCGIIIFPGGSIFVVFVDDINNEFRSPTNNDV